MRTALPVDSAFAFFAVLRLCSSVFNTPFSTTAFVRDGVPSASNARGADGWNGSSSIVTQPAPMAVFSRPASSDSPFCASSAENIGTNAASRSAAALFLKMTR